MYSLEEVIDTSIGQRGTQARENFEHELQLALMGDVIQLLRKKSGFTQDQLGKLVGVKKSWISKLENNSGDVTFDTFLSVLKAMKVKVDFYLVVNGRKFDLFKGKERELHGITVNGLLKILKILDKSAKIGMQMKGINLQVA